MFVCVALPGVFVYVCDCGVCVLRMCLWVVCKSCVMLYGVWLECCLCDVCVCVLCVIDCVML